jgi:hypothetical protein
MGEGGPEFDAMSDFDEGEESERRPAAEIVKGLEATWSLVKSCLRGWSEADLDARFQRPGPNAAGKRVARPPLHHLARSRARPPPRRRDLIQPGMHGIPAIDL